ncbi:MAG: transcriptional repressor LexA [Bacillota bacterium]
MSSDLTKRQRDVLSYIIESTRERGFPPSVREICQGVGLKSPSTVHSHLSSLEQKGYIRRDPSKGRAIEIVLDDAGLSPVDFDDVVAVPLVGRVTAGTPILAVENIEEYLPLPRSLTRGAQDGVFLLKVEGSSMIDSGILDGDTVVVRRQNHADNGDIVVAMVGDEEATVKRFYREKDAVRLQPENRSMEPIITRDVTILGLVVGLFRLV